VDQPIQQGIEFPFVYLHGTGATALWIIPIKKAWKACAIFNVQFKASDDCPSKENHPTLGNW